MASMLNITQIAGPHANAYESYYQQLDPAYTGQITAGKAAIFLKTSKLPDLVLSKIWDLSDPKGNGYLDKQGLYTALKLVSLAQIGIDVSNDSLTVQTPLPRMGEQIIASPPPNDDWTIKFEEKQKYDELFDSLEPINDRLPGSKVKPVMVNSKLPVETLGKIWDLSDIDNDGFLDRDEFTVGMHLVYKALENYPVPSTLPPSLFPVSKKKKSLPGSVQVLPGPKPRESPTPSLGSVSSTDSTYTMSKQMTITWVVSASPDKAKYDVIFKTVDSNNDGLVSGGDVKNTFLQSGLAQNVLAHIWTLCDMTGTGNLNGEQFALAMYLVNMKLQGGDIPATLTPEMIPPTLRMKPNLDSSQASESDKSTESEMNSELALISKEIEELQREKMQLEQDIAQKEADITIRNGEVNSLQNMLNSLAGTLKQLEIQKGEAQKRLDDLDSQTSILDKDIQELQRKVKDESCEVERLKSQLKDQEENLTSQESELNSKRHELNNLRLEETKLQEQVQSGKTQLDGLNKSLQDTHLLITQTRSKITEVQETQKHICELICQYDSAISSGDISSISELSLRTVTPTLSEHEYSRLTNTGGSSPVSSVGAFSTSGFAGSLDDFKDDPFKNKEPFINGFGQSLSADDPFISDPFKGADRHYKTDIFSESSANDDPFGGTDPFFTNNPVSSTVESGKTDPFDPFSLSAGSVPSQNVSSDPFGGDPFSSPPVAPRSESPTPALPPKKSKAPPPRPAPPKGITSRGPMRAAPPAPDPFSGGSQISDAEDPFASVFDNRGSGVSPAVVDNSNYDPFKATESAKTPDPFANTGSNDAFADFASFD